MNKKRKILTLVALVVFGVIIFRHNTTVTRYSVHSDIMTAERQAAEKERGIRIRLKDPAKPPSHDGFQEVWVEDPYTERLIDDVRMPLLALAIFYAGLFAILGDNKRKEQ